MKSLIKKIFRLIFRRKSKWEQFFSLAAELFPAEAFEYNLLGGQIIGGLLMKKPEVPEFQPLDLQAEQQQALQGNIASGGLLSKMSKMFAGMSAEQRETLFPGSSALIAQTTGQISSALAGELPADVQKLIAQRAAERGVSMGTAGSQFAQFGELADIGMTSMQRIQQGIDSATRWVAMAESTSQAAFQPMQFTVTPGMQAEFSQNERNMQFQRDWVANQVEAAYDPWTIIGQGIIAEDAQIVQLASSFLSSAGGAMAASDRNMKDHIKELDDDQILKLLDHLDIFEWQYIGAETRHVGPMAQDFNKVFDVGTDKEIYLTDGVGIALSAIKALKKRVEELESHHAKLV